MSAPERVGTAAIRGLADGLTAVATAMKQATEEFTQLGFELQVAAGVVPGSFGSVIRLRNSCRWAVAGTWLIGDEQMLEPRTWWERLLAGLVRDVRDGRLLADAGF